MQVHASTETRCNGNETSATAAVCELRLTQDTTTDKDAADKKKRKEQNLMDCCAPGSRIQKKSRRSHQMLLPTHHHTDTASSSPDEERTTTNACQKIQHTGLQTSNETRTEETRASERGVDVGPGIGIWSVAMFGQDFVVSVLDD